MSSRSHSRSRSQSPPVATATSSAAPSSTSSSTAHPAHANSKKESQMASENSNSKASRSRSRSHSRSHKHSSSSSSSRPHRRSSRSHDRSRDRDQHRRRSRSRDERRHNSRRSRSRSRSPQHSSSRRAHSPHQSSSRRNHSSRRRSSRSRSSSRRRSRSRSGSSSRRARRRANWDALPTIENQAMMALGMLPPIPSTIPFIAMTPEAQAAARAHATQQALLIAMRASANNSSNTNNNHNTNSSSNNNSGAQSVSSLPKHQRPTRIYVGSISYDAGEKEVREVFSQFGTIVELEMPFDPNTKRHRGHAFIQFTKEEDATRAITETNGLSVWGRQIKVNRPNESSANQSNSQQQSAAFDGFPGLTGLSANGTLLNNRATLAPSSSAISTSSSPMVSDALAAMRSRMAAGITLPASIASSSQQSLARRIYVGNLSFDMSSAHVKQLFTPFGPISSVEIVMDREVNKPRGYGFVLFEKEEDAASAIKSMQDFILCGRTIKVNAASQSGSAGTINLERAQVNQHALAQARFQAQLLQQAGIGSGLSAASSGNYESDGYISSATQRVALMEKMAGRGAGGSAESCVVLLKNLVGVGEVDAELEDEVRDEANQHGTVQKIKIHQTKTQVLIYLLFTDIASAVRARLALDKRPFGARSTTAIFYSKEKFDRGIYQDV